MAKAVGMPEENPASKRKPVPLLAECCGWCGKPVKMGDGNIYQFPVIVTLHRGDCQDGYFECLRKEQERIKRRRERSPAGGMANGKPGDRAGDALW